MLFAHSRLCRTASRFRNSPISLTHQSSEISNQDDVVAARIPRDNEAVAVTRYVEVAYELRSEFRQLFRSTTSDRLTPEVAYVVARVNVDIVSAVSRPHDVTCGGGHVENFDQLAVFKGDERLTVSGRAGGFIVIPAREQFSIGREDGVAGNAVGDLHGFAPVNRHFP